MYIQLTRKYDPLLGARLFRQKEGSYTSSHIVGPRLQLQFQPHAHLQLCPT